MRIEIADGNRIRIGEWPYAVDVTDMGYTGTYGRVYTGLSTAPLTVQLRYKDNDVSLFVMRELNLPEYWKDSTLLWEKRIEIPQGEEPSA